MSDLEQPIPYADAAEIAWAWADSDYTAVSRVANFLWGVIGDSGTDLRDKVVAAFSDRPQRIGDVACEDFTDAESAESVKTKPNGYTVFNGQLPTAELAALPEQKEVENAENNGRPLLELRAASRASLPWRRRATTMISAPLVTAESLGAAYGSYESAINFHDGNEVGNPILLTMGFAIVSGLSIATARRLALRRQGYAIMRDAETVREHIRDESRGGIVIPDQDLKIHVPLEDVERAVDEGRLQISDVFNGKYKDFGADLLHVRVLDVHEDPTYDSPRSIYGKVNVPTMVKSLLQDLHKQGGDLREIWNADGGMHAQLVKAPDIVKDYIDAKREFDRDKEIAALSGITDAEAANHINGEYQQAQIAVLGLVSRIATVHKEGVRTIKHDEAKALVESFGDAVPEAAHPLQTKLDAFKSVIYSAMIDELDKDGFNETAQEISDYFSSMRKLITDPKDLRRLYEGAVKRFDGKLVLPQWDAVEKKILNGAE